MNTNTDKPMEGWEKRFDNKFVWEVRPVGIKKGDKEQEEYVLGLPMSDWADKVTLGEIKHFIQQTIEEERGRMLKEGKKQENERLWELVVNMENPYEKNVKLFSKTAYLLGFERCRAMLIGELLNSKEKEKEKERELVLEEINAMLVRMWKEEASDERLDCIFEIREKVNSLLKSNTKK